MTTVQCLEKAYEREASRLTATEAGVLWGLTALAGSGMFGRNGVVSCETRALAEMLCVPCINDVLTMLNRHGKVRAERNDRERVTVRVCFWYDRFYGRDGQ